MTWLLWKDYRHNRLIVFAGLFFLLVPHLIAPCIVFYTAVHDLPHALTWRQAFAGSSLYSLMLSQLTIALIGGNAIAGERVDRSAEFLASLPVTRRRIIASKLLLAGAIVATVWLLNAPIFMWVIGGVQLPPEMSGVLIQLLSNIAITGTVLFCVAWCLSSFIASPTFAVCGGFAIPFLVMVTLSFGAHLLGMPAVERNMEFWYPSICLTLAPLCFAVGTWHYLRRVEP